MSKLAMIVKTKTQPNQRVEALHLFEKHLAQRAQANDAQELVVWCADESDADTFYLVEIYSSRDAFQANGQAGFQEGWFLAYMQEVQPLLAGEPTVIMATPQWAKGIQL
jgi:quinol monooxygenase YgiN